MRSARVKYKGEDAGILIQKDDGTFMFKYEQSWINNGQKPSISLTLPKTKVEYKSETLFPFFYSLLPEGANKKAICTNTRIDENDPFGLLLQTAGYDTIGAVTVHKMITE